LLVEAEVGQIHHCPGRSPLDRSGVDGLLTTEVEHDVPVVDQGEKDHHDPFWLQSKEGILLNRFDAARELLDHLTPVDDLVGRLVLEQVQIRPGITRLIRPQLVLVVEQLQAIQDAYR